MDLALEAERMFKFRTDVITDVLFVLFLMGEEIQDQYLLGLL
jgi:hypothetical protein